MKGKNFMQSVKEFKGKKLFVMCLSLALVLCTVVVGTIAWLVANTKPVVNTFTYGDINITLEETDTNLDGDNDVNTNDYQMIPGNGIKKDPKVTVKAGSEDAWLFVKLEKSSNFDSFMTYNPADGWTELSRDGNSVIYYRETAQSDTDTEYEVLKADADKNTVFVKDDVTKQMLNDLDSGATANYPTLTVTAYAVQKANIDSAADAWTAINANANP